MGGSTVGGLVGCFAGGAGVASVVIGLAVRAASLNTLPDLVTFANISVA